MKLSREVMLGGGPKLCLLIALSLAPAPCTASGGACERGRTWWDREHGSCAPCTRCEPTHAVKLPCELHRDTVCQPLHELRIFPFHNTNELDEDYSEYYEEDYANYEVSEDAEVRWDLDLAALGLAASGCVVFFVVVLYFSVFHWKQWKVLKQALRSDIQDLSAKLKLMEAGEIPAEPATPTDHHLYCNIHVTKDALVDPVTDKGLGNVYTQEKHPT